MLTTQFALYLDTEMELEKDLVTTPLSVDTLTIGTAKWELWLLSFLCKVLPQGSDWRIVATLSVHIESHMASVLRVDR
jgi:hypothetical protein